MFYHLIRTCFDWLKTSFLSVKTFPFGESGAQRRERSSPLGIRSKINGASATGKRGQRLLPTNFYFVSFPIILKVRISSIRYSRRRCRRGNRNISRRLPLILLRARGMLLPFLRRISEQQAETTQRQPNRLYLQYPLRVLLCIFRFPPPRPAFQRLKAIFPPPLLILCMLNLRL